MSAFLVVVMTVRDASWQEEYRAHVPAVLEKFGGSYLAVTPNVEILEGNAVLPDMGAILQFPDLSSLKGFLQSDEYKPYKDARIVGSDSIMYAIDG